MKIIKISTGIEHVLALSSINNGGKVFSWGSSSHCQLGFETHEHV